MNDLERLLALAEAIAKGAPIDAEEAARAIADDAGTKPWSPDDLERLIAALQRIDHAAPDRDEPQPRSPGGWGRLTIIRAIGAGPFGTIYRAHDPHLGIDVALELLDPAESPEVVSRFVKAGRHVLRLRHPNVVRWYGLEEWAGCAGAWMELVKGQSLEQLALSTGRVQAEEATNIARTLCQAAAVIQQAGLPYPDISVANVVREDSGRIVLTEPITRTVHTTSAHVIDGIGRLISHLTGTAPASLAAIIERATTPAVGSEFVSLDVFESALSSAVASKGESSARAKARSWWNGRKRR